MSASNVTDSPTVPTDIRADLRVDCYVRSGVPGPTAETISTIVDRLQQLSDDGHISTCRIGPWPAEHHAALEEDETRDITRCELVAEFEHWAERHDVTLEPAFRRREVPPSPLGIGSGEPYEQVRVPLVALALSEDDADTESASLRGVVPYTESPQTAAARTHTVDEWLTAAETDAGGTVARDSRAEQQSLLEGQR